MRTRILELLSELQIASEETISVSDLHRATGVSRQTIHRWMNNDLKRFDEETVIAFCKFFGCTIDELLYVDWEAR